MAARLLCDVPGHPSTARRLTLTVFPLEQTPEEGPIAKGIERQTTKLPSDWFLFAAIGAMTASMTLQAMRKDHASLFVGQWVPTILILGLYNKLVKQLGSDRTENTI
jgi:hypothetical protein